MVMNNEGANAMNQTFDHGLNKATVELLTDLHQELNTIKSLIEDAPKHRTFSLAITKIEEAQHWLMARLHTPAS